MKILLDTCCLVWAVADPQQLSQAAAALLQADDTSVSVSAISCAEVACLADRGRIRLDRHWRAWFREAVRLNGWDVHDVSLQVVEEAFSLPGEFHRDPADRLLVAAARLGQYTILTADRKILDYPHVQSVW